MATLVVKGLIAHLPGGKATCVSFVWNFYFIFKEERVICDGFVRNVLMVRSCEIPGVD